MGHYLHTSGETPTRVAVLFDASCGMGIAASSFPPPHRVAFGDGGADGGATTVGVPSGYAGGLGAHNLAAALAALRDDAGQTAAVWVDMESRLRAQLDGADVFDVTKVVAAAPGGWEGV